MSTTHKTSAGEPIAKADQLVNLHDLMHKCRELVILLDMQKNGKIPNISEKKILKRFESIHTTKIIDTMIEWIWEKDPTQ